jgi:hypothetical protein
MGFSASTPFIGLTENNFSHKIKNRSESPCRILIHIVQLWFTHCPEAMQTLYCSASPFCIASLQRGAAKCPVQWPLQALFGALKVVFQPLSSAKKRRQENCFLPPPVLTATEFCALLEL